MSALLLYILILRREKRQRKKLERLTARGYVYVQAPAGAGAITSHGLSYAEEVLHSMPELPSEALTPPKGSRHLPPTIPLHTQHSIPTQLENSQANGPEAEELIDENALSRQTTQYSCTSTLVAEVPDSTPSTPRSPRRRSVRQVSTISWSLMPTYIIQSRRKPSRRDVHVPPVPQVPLPVLEMPRLTESFESDFLDFAYSNRWSKRGSTSLSIKQKLYDNAGQ